MSTGQNLLQRLGFDHPIIQAPMAGGGDTPDLVAAVCNAGALGFIGGAYLTPQQIVEASRAIRAKTSRAFGINLFAPQLPAESGISAEAAVERLGGYYAELGLDAPAQSETASYTLREQLIVALESGASAFSFTFGIFPADAIAAIRERGMLAMGTASLLRWRWEQARCNWARHSSPATRQGFRTRTRKRFSWRMKITRALRAAFPGDPRAAS